MVSPDSNATIKRLVRVVIFTLEYAAFIATLSQVVSAIDSLVGISDTSWLHVAISVIVGLVLLWPTLALDRRLWRWLVRKGVAEPRHVEGGRW